MLIEAAQSASHSRNSYLGEVGRRIAARRGKKVAVVAVAHRIVLIIYQVLKKGEDYKELGADYYQREEAGKERAEPRLIRQLERKGYEVKLKAAS